MTKLHAVGAGLVGTLLALALWHIYNDHLLIHAVVDAINKAAAAAPKP